MKNKVNQTDVKGHGYLRKTKAFGLASGIALAGALVALGGNVSADEVTTNTSSATTAETTVQTTDNSATNLISAQEATTDANLGQQAATGTQTGSITTPVESSALDTAANSAKSAGVDVATDATMTYEKKSEADTDLSKQEKVVDEATKTKQSVDQEVSQAKKTAEEVGVKVTNTEKVTYTNDNAGAKADAKGQVANLETVTSAQKEIATSLPQAVKTAEDAGVKVTVSEGVSYSDAKKAIEDLQAQVAKLNTAQDTQRQIASALALAVADAKKAGLSIKTGQNATYSDVQQALADMQAQLDTLANAEKAQASANKIVSDAKNQASASGTVVKDSGEVVVSADEAQKLAQDTVDKIRDTINYNDQTLAENKAKEESYKKEVAAVEAKNKEAQEKYDKELAEYNSKLQEVAQRRKVSQQSLEEFEKVKQGTVSNLPNDNGHTPSNSTTHLTSKTIKGIEFVSSGDLSNPTIYMKGNVDKSKVVTKVEWGNVAPEGDDLMKGVYGSGDWTNGTYWKGAYNYNQNGTTTQIWTAKRNNWYKIKDAITTMDGKKHDAFVSVDLDTSGLYHESAETKTDGNYFVMWNQDGAINTIDGFRDGVNTKSDGLRVRIRVDSVDNTDEYIWNSVMYDIDGGQFVLIGENNTAVLAVGGGMKVSSTDKNQIASDENLGYTYGKNMSSLNALNGRYSSPDGTVVFVQVGRQYNTILRNSAGGNSAAVVRSDFGADSKITFKIVETVEDPKKPEPPKMESANLGKPTPLKEVEAPTIVVSADTHNIDVAADTHAVTMTASTHEIGVATSVHKVQVTQKPSNNKSVTNTENVDINSSLVAKGSTVDWKLSNEALKAARDYTVSYVMEDALPSGFNLNLQATADASPAYTFNYNAKTRTLIATATADTLYGMNADLTATYNVPLVTVVGTVSNDAATYKNTFTTTVTTAETVIRDNKGNVTPNGKTDTYKKTSNTVVVYTPGSNVRTYNGNVIVRYFEDGTNVKIAPNQVDVEDAKVGTPYDTTDQKQDTIAYEGKLYKLTSKVVGNETGKVTDGTTYVDYFYKLVDQEKGKGNVVVHYVNEDGDTISNDVVDSDNVPTGTDYDTKDHKPTTITTEDNIEYTLIPEKTIGEEEGKVTEGTTEITYVYKRVTPKPETPTPTDNIISPVKHIYNKDGQQIDGVTILPNSKVYYTATYDADQFKNMKATAADIAKGFALIDDIEDNTVTLDVANAVVTTADGTVQKDLTVAYYHSIDEAPAELQQMLAGSGTKVDGNFVAVVPVDNDYTSFYNKYIVTGKSFYTTIPVITGDYVGTFKNHIAQIAFGNGYDGNIVENNIPKLEALKDVVEAVGSSKSLANGNVALNQVFPYELDGPGIATNVDGGLNKYVISDDFDEVHDRYDGVFYAFAQQDLELKDGTVIKKGDEITRFVTQNIERNEDGTASKVTYTFNADFLESLKVASDNIFDPVVYMQVTRIAYGESVENRFEVAINDYVVESNTVVTHTRKPEPKVPEKTVRETPKPSVPVEVPVQKAAVLPKTGEENSTTIALAGAGMLLATLGLTYKGKKNDQD